MGYDKLFILIGLLAISAGINWQQSSTIDELNKSNETVTQQRDSAINNNAHLSAQIERTKQERDSNQKLVDLANEKNHQLQQQAQVTQNEVRTVIQYEECTNVAIPSAAIERMRKQYQSSDTIQNNRTKTTTHFN